MFIHDAVKMLYINEGYLPGYPYHLISDAEMFDAFLREGGFFDTFYPCPSDELQFAYDELRQYIVDRIDAFQNGQETALPDWIYSYMILTPITFSSKEVDIDYLNDLAHVEQESGLPQFTEDTAAACYETSRKWLMKQPTKRAQRPPTVFGEPHVIKSLRLAQSDFLQETPEGN